MKRHPMLPLPHRALGLGALGLTLLTQTACPTVSGKLGGLETGADPDSGGDAGTDGATSGVDPTATGGMDDAGSDDGSGSTGEPPMEGCEGQIDVGPSIARVMDARRWSHAIEDLLGVTPPAIDLPPASNGTEFDVVPLTQAATGQLVGGAMQAAAMLPDGYVPCAGDEDTCLADFAGPLASRAWRRPATADEVTTLVDLSAGQPYDDRVRVVVTDVLQHPDFYEVTEVGAPDSEDPTRTVIDDRSIATRMARLLWNSIPDQELLDAAAAGQLADPQVRRQQVQRMLGLPRAATAVGDFTEMWLRLDELDSDDKDPGIFPEFDAALADAMREEARRFAVATTLNGDGLWDTLTTSTTTYANADLAALYGVDVVSPPPAGGNFEAVQLDPTRRGGIYTLSGPLATWADDDGIGIVPRGEAVWRAAFCGGILPPPPPSVEPPDLEDIDAENRPELHAQVFTADPECAGCHVFSDPLTWGLDNYDGLGRWQTELDLFGGPAGADAVPVAAWGEASPMTYESREDYLQQLRTNDEARRCLIEHRIEFAFDRAMVGEDECWVYELRNAFDASGGHLPTLLEDIVAHASFVLARPS